MRSIIVGLVMLGATALPPGHQATAAGDDPWAPLELIEVETEQATIWIDPALAAESDRIETGLVDAITAIRAQQATTSSMLEKKALIIVRINELMGYEPDDQVAERQRDTFDRVAGMMRVQYADPGSLHLRVLMQQTIKDYLRAGAALPSLTYDAQTDVVSYRYFIEGGSRGASPPTIDSLVIAVETIDKLDETLRMPSDFATFTTAFEAFCIHEIVELSFHWMTRPSDLLIRWFGDGIANVVTMQVLEDLGETELRAQLADSLDVDRYRDLLRESNLRYWPAATYELHWPIIKPESPVESERRLRLARYAFAHDEIDRLVRLSSWDHIRTILVRAAEVERLDSAALLQIIREETGENLSARLYRYQSFHSVRQGSVRYGAEVDAAQRAHDLEAEYTSMCRLIELSLADGYFPNLYAVAAELLGRMGHVDAGESILRHHVDIVEDRGADNLVSMLPFLINYAFTFDEPARAYDVAERMLELEPGDVRALIIRAHRLDAAGEVAEARALAQQLLDIEGATWTRLARDMLERIAATDEQSAPDY